MKIEKSRTLTSDNIELETVKYIPESPKGIIYICHGVTVPKEAPANILKEVAIALVETDFKVITFDFRGHGPSAGKDCDFTIEKGQLDLDAVFKTETNNLPIGMLGFSCGASIITLYSHFNKIKLGAMVFFSPALEWLECSINNANSVIGQSLITAKTSGDYERDGYVKVPNGFCLGRAFFEEVAQTKIDKYVPLLKTRLLICQAKRDQMLDFNLTKKLGEPICDKYVVYDAVHALTEVKDQAIKETVEWFNKYLI